MPGVCFLPSVGSAPLTRGTKTEVNDLEIC